MVTFNPRIFSKQGCYDLETARTLFSVKRVLHLYELRGYPARKRPLLLNQHLKGFTGGTLVKTVSCCGAHGPWKRVGQWGHGPGNFWSVIIFFSIKAWIVCVFFCQNFKHYLVTITLPLTAAMWFDHLIRHFMILPIKCIVYQRRHDVSALVRAWDCSKVNAKKRYVACFSFTAKWRGRIKNIFLSFLNPSRIKVRSMRLMTIPQPRPGTLTSLKLHRWLVHQAAASCHSPPPTNQTI